MKKIVKRLLILGMILGWGIQGVWAEPVTNITPQAGEWLKKAYLAVVDAEMARAENHDAEAAQSFRTAIGFYNQLSTEYPGWQSTLVSSRVAECQKALLALEMPREPKVDKDKAGETVATVTNAEVRLQGLLRELRAVQVELAQVKTAGDDSQAKQREADVDRLKDELNDATKANLVQQRKIAKLEAKLKKNGDMTVSGTNAVGHAVVSAVKSEANRLMKINDVNQAITLLTESLELLPSETDLVVLLAVADCRDGRFAEAVKLMAPFDVWRGKNADALLTLGTAYMGMGELGKARDAVEKALAINPDYAEAHFNLAQILLTIKPPDVTKSQEHYQRAVELGSPVDLEFENALRTAMIISRMKKKTGSSVKPSPRTMNSDIRTPGATTGTP